SLAAQRSLVFAPDKLRPRLSRIDPVAGAAQKFGRAMLVEFGKNACKLFLFGAAAWAFLQSSLADLAGLATLSAAGGTIAGLGLVGRFLGWVVALALVLGAADFLWQRAEFLRRNRMSRQELM